MHPLATLGSAEDFALLRRFPAQLARDSRGVTYALATLRDHEVLVFEPDGAQRRILGGIGAGPGEYQRPIALAVGPGDSVFLAHDYFRMTVYGPDGEVGRTLTTPAHVRDMFIALPDSRIVIPGLVTDPEPVPMALHLVGVEGELLRSFSQARIVTLPRGNWSSEQFRRKVYADGAGSVWSTAPFVAPRYEEGEPLPNIRLDQYDTLGHAYRNIMLEPPSGTQLDERVLDMTAFADLMAQVAAERVEEGSRLLRFPQMAAQPFAIAGLYHAQDGALLLASRFLPLGWQHTDLYFERPAPGELVISDANFPGIFRTMIDVVDLDTGELLVRHIMPGYGQLLNDGTLAMMKVSDDGIYQIDLFELEIVGL